MAKTKEQKAEIVAKLEEAFKGAASTVFLHFRGVSVADETALRRGLRADEVKYVVAKKTLIRRALENLGHKASDLSLDGEVAIAYGGGADATAAARLIHDPGKKLVDKLVILGGIFEGKLQGQAQMQEIATIPSMPQLRGMFVNVINSPIQGMAIVLQAIADKSAQGGSA